MPRRIFLSATLVLSACSSAGRGSEQAPQPPVEDVDAKEPSDGDDATASAPEPSTAPADRPTPIAERGGQCNLLIDAVNAHLPELAAATETFSELQENPGVIEEYETAVQEAIDEVESLEIADETVQSFARRYVDLFGEAKDVGAHLGAAAKDSDLLPAVVREADAIAEAEETLVSDIGAYCNP